MAAEVQRAAARGDKIHQRRARVVLDRDRPQQIQALIDELLRRQRAAVLSGEAVDNGPHARLVQAAELLRHEVDALDQRTAVDPLHALVPALD